MTAADLPGLNAGLNTISTILLTLGFLRIRRGDRAGHQRAMLAAVGTSALFLLSYLVYHAEVGSVPYPLHDWTRPVYFAILVPHVILAALMVPFILLARRVWPVWMFVSISGVVIYWMLYHVAGAVPAAPSAAAG
jgi:putative membrane protein